MMNLINEEAETVPVGTFLDLTPYSTAELHVMPAPIHLNMWTIKNLNLFFVTFSIVFHARHGFVVWESVGGVVREFFIFSFSINQGGVNFTYYDLCFKQHH